MVLVPREDWAALTGRPSTIGGLAAAALHMKATDSRRLDALVEKVESETWRYRPDLSLFPAKG